jgi:hypothetical protein
MENSIATRSPFALFNELRGQVRRRTPPRGNWSAANAGIHSVVPHFSVSAVSVSAFLELSLPNDDPVHPVTTFAISHSEMRRLRVDVDLAVGASDIVRLDSHQITYANNGSCPLLSLC